MLKVLDFEWEVVIKDGPNLPLNREVIAETAIERGCTHLLFIDNDMVFPNDALPTLLRHNKDIIGANYNMRRLPLQSTVKGQGEGLQKVEAVATGFMLIKTDVFTKIPKPWFHVGQLAGGGIEGHDYRFCRLAQEAGYEVWCDFSVPMKHVGDYLY